MSLRRSSTSPHSIKACQNFGNHGLSKFQKGFFSQLSASPHMVQQLKQKQFSNQSSGKQSMHSSVISQERQKPSSAYGAFQSQSQQNLMQSPQFPNCEQRDDATENNYEINNFNSFSQIQNDKFSPYISSENIVDINLPLQSTKLQQKPSNVLTPNINKHNTHKENVNNNKGFQKPRNSKETSKALPKSRSSSQLSSKKQYVSRNQPQQLQDNKTLQQVTHQSSLCNMASVKNTQVPLNFNEADGSEVKQVRDLKESNQKLEKALKELKEKSKKDKENTLKYLHKIEENYQKYAFYYAKYLEDKMTLQQQQQQFQELQTKAQESDNKSEQLLDLSLDLLETIISLRDRESLGVEDLNCIQKMIVGKLMDLNIQSEALPQESRAKQIADTAKKPLTSKDAYESAQKPQHSQSYSSQKSNHKRGSSSTPKSQQRYQEQCEEDEEAYQMNEGDQMRERAQQLFRQSISSPSTPYDRAEDQATQSTFSQQEQAANAIKSHQYSDCNRQRESVSCSGTQHNEISKGIPIVPNVEKDERRKEAGEFLLQNPKQIFNYDMVISELDTFSPKQFEEARKSCGLASKGEPKELKYSVEYVNGLDDVQLEGSMCELTRDNDRKKIEIAVALRGFKGERDQDLDLKGGDKILIESKIKGSSWMFGSIGLRKGWFPANMVRIEEHFI